MTLAEARTYVLARLGISSGESAAIEALVDQQLDTEYQRLVLELHLEVDVAFLIVTADDPVVELPDDLNEILKINRGTLTLVPLDWDTFAGEVAGATTHSGDGAVAYVRSGSRRIRIHPTPAEDATDLTCWYAVEADAWDQDAEEPVALPRAFHDLPCERVVAWLAALDEEPLIEAGATARAEALAARLRRHIARRGGMGPASIHIYGTNAS